MEALGLLQTPSAAHAVIAMQDCLEHNAASLLMHCLQHHEQRNVHVVVLDLLATLPAASFKGNVVCFPSDACLTIDRSNVEAILAIVAEHLEASDAKRSTVILPALDILLEFVSLTTFQNWLSLVRKVNKGLSIVYSYHNQLSRSLRHALASLATARMQCLPLDGFSLLSPMEQQHDAPTRICSVITHTVAHSGKVRVWDEAYQVEGDSLVPIQGSLPSQPNPVATEDAPLLESLTFNLKLTPAEEEARAQAVLPYTKAAEAAYTVELQGPKGGGTIFYEPDDVDDFDDEDPDEDLDL